jgi:YVTN family beta-propeller protein
MTVGSPSLRRCAIRCVSVLAFTLINHFVVANAQSSTAAQPVTGEAINRQPNVLTNGADLPNGWRVTPAGKTLTQTGDLVLNLTVSPDGRAVIGVHGGFLPHGLDVFDARSQQLVQQIPLTTAWVGLSWSGDGRTLYVAGGNASGKRSGESAAPVYEFSYADGKLSEKPAHKLEETIYGTKIWWSGVAYLPGKNLVYAVNRGTSTDAGNVVVFDAASRKIVTHIPVGITPYQAVLAKDGSKLFVSNWSDASVSVIDTASNTVIKTIPVGLNPNDMRLSADGRLFVACSNDNTVHVIDTASLGVIEKLSTTLTPQAPEGSTPDALAIDDERKLLYIANADNNSVAVVNIANPTHSSVEGFIPVGWYPSSLALAEGGKTLFVGTGKGEQGHPDPDGPHSPLVHGRHEVSVKTVQTGSVEAVSVAELKEKLPRWTKQVADNTPYNDSLLAEARPARDASIVPQKVGEHSPIKHVIYIIKENRTYDQEFGDLLHANGDPRLTIFGEDVTPNQHALAKQYVILDNLYCDGEVSVDGHSWSNSAYATDFNEKQWPPLYAARSAGTYSVRAMVPSAGHLWDAAARKGLTYRSYGENAARASTGTGDTMKEAPGAEGLRGHVAPDYPNGLAMRDSEKIQVFVRDLKAWDENYGSTDAEKRMPNYIVMSMPEDHTEGTRTGAFTPRAMVADNDYAIGVLVDAVTHSRYWSSTAIFIIEDDAQDGSDHVDARRTVGLVISPYVKRNITDSTLYSTSSMVRTMELLLGLPPMSQYDAAAMPMYASFGTQPVLSQFDVMKPRINVLEKNGSEAFGASLSNQWDFTQPDLAPMHALNEIIWKSVKGADSTMPAPVHRFRPLIDVSGKDKDGDGD